MVDKTSLPPTYDEVNQICKDVLEEVIGQSTYQHGESVKWTSKAVENITEGLVALNRNYKFCVCCIIMQTGLGAGLNVSSTCYWDKQTDFCFCHSMGVKSCYCCVQCVCAGYAISSPPIQQLNLLNSKKLLKPCRCHFALFEIFCWTSYLFSAACKVSLIVCMFALLLSL